MFEAAPTVDDPDALLAEDPNADPHQLLLLAQVYPDKVLANASLLLLHFVDLDLARSIHATARSTLAADTIEALVASCGPRALALFAAHVARRAVRRWDPALPRPGKVLRALDLIEQNALGGGASGQLAVISGQLKGRIPTLLPFSRAVNSAALALWHALTAAQEGRASARRAALDAAEHAATALADGDEMAYTEERELQAQALAELHTEHGAL